MKPEYSGIRAVLLDIEGTTTPIDFVHKTLFSYADEQVADFIHKNSGDSKVVAILENLYLSYRENGNPGRKPAKWNNEDSTHRDESAVEYVRWLISLDSKDPALKELQGIIWEEGYKSAKLHGEVYPDVPEVMRRWSESGIIMAIYSSGSVLAQKLIFGSTLHGDLTVYLSDFFDTGVGTKRDPESYRNISGRLGIPPEEILFLSDVLEEVTAARASGLKAVQVIRDGHNTARDKSFRTISNLMELLPCMGK